PAPARPLLWGRQANAGKGRSHAANHGPRHAGGPDVPARREAGRAVGAGAAGVLAEGPGPPAPAHPPRGPDGGDLHRRRGPGLPCGPAPPGGRLRRRRLPDESRRRRDYRGARAGPRSTALTWRPIKAATTRPRPGRAGRPRPLLLVRLRKV